MNKLWLLILIPVILSGFACATTPDEPATGALSTKITTLSDWMTKVEGATGGLVTYLGTLRRDIDTKASKTEIDDINRKINNLPTGGATTSYTKAEVDAKISDAITALKNEKPWGSSSSSSSSSTDEGDIVSSNGNMELIIERSPGDEEVWVNDKIPVEWRFTVKNKGTSGSYFRITANFDTTDTSATIAEAKITPSYSDSSMQFTPNPFTSPATAVSSISFTSQASGSDSRVWIPKNSEKTVYLVLYIDYQDTTVNGKRWAWDFTIRELH